MPELHNSCKIYVANDDFSGGKLMYKLLIVDDNPNDISIIEQLIDFKPMGICVTGKCINGEQALQEVEKERPDMIITDITMPVMNGLEMSAIIKEKYPKSKIIFMSNYNDFKYMRSAILLDGQDYILKPIVKEELVNAILKVLKKFELEKEMEMEKVTMLRQIDESLPSLQDQFFRELIFGTCHDVAEILSRMELLKLPRNDISNIMVVTIEMDDNQKSNDSVKMEDKYYAMYSLTKIIKSYTSDTFYIYTVQISNKEIAIVIFNKNKSENNKNLFIDVMVEISEKINSRFSFDITMGISKISYNISDLPALFNQSILALKSKFYSARKSIVFFDEIEEIEKNLFEEIVDIKALFKDVKELLSAGKSDDIQQFVKKLLYPEGVVYSENYIKSLTFTIINVLQVVINENNTEFNSIFNDELAIWKKLSRFDTIKDINNWIFNILNVSREFMQNKFKTNDVKIVEDIKLLIKEKYNEQLTIGEIIKPIFISPSQANNIFKKVTGKTIFDFLTEYRVEMAKKMLKDPYSRVYLVAQQTGYTNKSHFCLIFKRITGMSPAEFKEREVL